ncbi:hypothetical protein EBO15_07890 [Actinomadura harenae]|uniref:Uncharacterized protein n=1 Tax=Actinomadura harenae TaxID=2483351 RepID=A0A3M2M8J0_9ACTN|nr:hypothetical protein EBO15_07890 [Actinomadura harenae]
MDQDSCLAQPLEELGLRPRGGGCVLDASAESGAGILRQADTLGFLHFAAGGAAGGRQVARGGPSQSELVFDCAAEVPDQVPVVPGGRANAVGAGQRGDHVDVVDGVPDGDPADGVRVALGRESDSVHHLARDPRPLRIGQDRVLGRGAKGRMPNRSVVVPVSQQLHRVSE